MFGFIIWLSIGGGIGWLASALRRTVRQHIILTNIIAGMVGAYAGGALLAPRFQSGPVLPYVIACGGAVTLVAMVWLARRAKTR